jgi:hypothetical protein
MKSCRVSRKKRRYLRILNRKEDETTPRLLEQRFIA